MDATDTPTLTERLRDRMMLFRQGTTFVCSDDPDPLCNEAADELDRLTREVAALRADAERYRFLRGQWTYGEWSVCLRRPIEKPAHIDDAIDTARGDANG